MMYEVPFVSMAIYCRTNDHVGDLPSCEILHVSTTRVCSFHCCRCRVLSLVHDACSPEVVVLQCGADTLVGDPMDSFSLTTQAVGECVRQVLSWDLPTLVLGGGGSHVFCACVCVTAFACVYKVHLILKCWCFTCLYRLLSVLSLVLSCLHVCRRVQLLQYCEVLDAHHQCGGGGDTGQRHP